MADTGLLDVGAIANPSNVFFQGSWVGCGSGVALWLSSGTMDGTTFSSDSLPDGAEVTGAEVYLNDTYGLSNAAASLGVKLSINGGSGFSSAISTGALGTTTTNDEVLGSSSNLWGLDWRGFTDLSDLHVRAAADGGQVVASDCVQLKIYYNAPASDDPSPTGITIKSGILTLKSATLTIK